MLDQLGDGDGEREGVGGGAKGLTAKCLIIDSLGSAGRSLCSTRSLKTNALRSIVNAVFLCNPHNHPSVQTNSGH